MITRCLAAALAAFTAAADTLEFRNGKTVENAQIVLIENGTVFFTYGLGHHGKTDVANLSAVRSEGDPVDCRLLRFEDATMGKETGRIAVIKVSSKRMRAPEPCVRVFSMQENARGERELVFYQNQRSKDPTLVYDIPAINLAAFQGTPFFLEVEGRALAWHVEVWVGGRLRMTYNEATIRLPDGWWRQRKPDRRVRIESEEELRLDPVDASVSAQITRCTPVQGLARNQPEIQISYLLRSAEKRIKVPAVTLYYVLEAPDGQRQVESESCEEGEGEEVDIARTLKRDCTVKLPKKTTLGLRGFNNVDDQDIRRLIYWRLDIAYASRVIATYESPFPEVRRKLGDTWWQD